MEKKDLVIGKKYFHKSNCEVYYLGEGNNKCSVVQPTNGVDGITSLKDSHPKIKDIIGNDRFWAYENIHLELTEIEPNLNLNELIIGEVYVSEIYNHPEWRSLLKCISNTDKAYSYKYRLYTSNDYHGNKLELHEYCFTDTNSHYKASKEESKWLNVCIKANKFIPKENLDLYDDVTFELKNLKAKTKDNAFLDDLITRAVILDNPNLIAEELGCTIQDIIDSKNDETYSCKKNQFDKLNSADCAGLSCYNNKCPFRSNSTITEEWLLSKVNENKFEVGTWYYCQSVFEWYFKYVKEDSSKIEFYDYIDIGLKRFERNDFLCNFTKKEIKNVRKADLSEIQEYLPELHIDKTIEEFTLPEKWWVRVTDENIDILSKWRNTNKLYLDEIVGMVKWKDGRLMKGHNPLNCIKCDNYDFGKEITFEQFKKYVLKDYIKESKEVILEYVECIGLLESKVQGWSNYYTIGKIYKNNFTSNDGFIYVTGNDGEEWACEISQFKPSTKEAFDAQNKPKPIEKWSVGSYVVALVDYVLSKTVKKGDIMEITSIKHNSIYFNNFVLHDYQKPTILPQLEWFATKSEAQEFSKTLLNKDDMFKKDDYIVITIPNQNIDGFITGFCYKQIDNDLYLRPELTTLGSIRNGWRLITYSSSHWRYATKKEIAEYDRLGKPFNVTTLNEKEELLDEVKRRYPIGSKFKCLHGCTGGPISNYNEIDFSDYGYKKVIRWYGEKGCGCLYDDNIDIKWAEIIYEDLPYMNISFQPYFEVMVPSDECNSKLDLSLRDEKEVNVNEVKSSNNNISKLNLSLNN